MKRSLLAIFVLIGLGTYAVISSNDRFGADSRKEETTETASKPLEVGLKEGNIAPDFTLYSLKGEEVSLSDYKGQIVFVNFWATWCPPCKAEMPHMEEFYEKSADEYDAKILAVNITSDEASSRVVEEFVKEHRITFPVLLDTDGKQTENFAAITIPTTYLVDRNGIIMKRIVGPMSMERMIELASSIE
ncbi:MAG: TlpA disulfide reductase family protein [Anaerobacillus sp.]